MLHGRSSGDGAAGQIALRPRVVLLLITIATLAAGCGSDGAPRGALVISEVMSDNDGAWVDDHGEADDYIEIVNLADVPASTAGYTLRDDSGGRMALPAIELAPGAALVLAADDSPAQGALHLPFKLSSDGDILVMEDEQGELERIAIPRLNVNDAYMRFDEAFSVCRYASPERANGNACGPPAPPALSDDARFSEYDWPEAWPELRGPLVLSELALSPAGFVEVLNVSDAPVELDGFALRLSAHGPGVPWPGAAEGTPLTWPEDELAPAARIAVPVTDVDLAAIAADPAFEGVATLFAAEGGEVVDRIDFMRWPAGAALTRLPDESGHPRFCAALTPGAANDPCDPLPSREVGDRLRHLYTPGDFAALADGDTSLTTRGVKFVHDMVAGDVVHLLGNRAWALHYTFIRERIEGHQPLDRCDAQQSMMFNQGWRTFSDQEYVRVDGRRYLLGTLNAHGGSGMHTLDFALGDAISGAQMLRAFFTVMEHVDDPRAWALRPAEPDHLREMIAIDGQAPIVGQNAPFQGVRYQPLTEGVGFGVLEFISAADLEDAALGPDVIVVTDDVPNDIPLVGGLITEAFQTPLAHVNVLSKNRGTPNMALRDARRDAGLEPLLGELVRLEVGAAGFTVRSASPDEADAFWQAQNPGGERIAPRRDLSVRGVQPLVDRSLDDLPSIGAKAAQLAELARVPVRCGAPVPVPRAAFAIPLVHYAEHFEQSGARARLDMHLLDADFRADPEVREEGLAQIRQAILETPVDAALLAEVEAAILVSFGADVRVRLRSSSNTEDLPAFNGAGLYTSLSAALDDPERTLDDGLRTVWASLWSRRAYDERELAHIDQSQVAMGVLVHEAFLSERANAVAISRNLLDPTRSEIHYMNAQIGEASVANPAPGVVTEQLIHHFRFVPDTPRIEYQSRSSLSHGAEVLSAVEVAAISCHLDAIHRHFRARLDPMGENRWFAVDIELKLLGDERRLLIKQARPYSFGRPDVPADCRET